MKAPAPVVVARVAVRMSSGTYAARVTMTKLTASCTEGPHGAARAVLRKLLAQRPDLIGPFTLKIARDDIASSLFDVQSWQLVPAEDRPFDTLTRSELAS